MITIRTDGVKELNIFRNFQKDTDLPKYRKEVQGQIGSGSAVYIASSSGTSTAVSGGIVFQDNTWLMSGNQQGWGGSTTLDGKMNPSFISKVISIIKGCFKSKPVAVDDTYAVIFKSLEELNEFNLVSSKLQEELKKAKQLNQRALFERLTDHLQIKMYENQLVAIKNLKFITEKKLIEFTEKCEKGLRLDWIQNFARTIPDKVSNRKLELDGYKIFDNYVIFHYDPDGKATELTKEEIRKKRDPILFGVIADSKNLYYVGDWIDEHCDLTFDKLIEKFSEEELTLKPNVK